MLLVAVLIAILNFQIVASFNLKSKKDKDTFCILKIAGIINMLLSLFLASWASSLIILIGSVEYKELWNHERGEHAHWRAFYTEA